MRIFVIVVAMGACGLASGDTQSSVVLRSYEELKAILTARDWRRLSDTNMASYSWLPQDRRNEIALLLAENVTQPDIGYEASKHLSFLAKQQLTEPRVIPHLIAALDAPQPSLPPPFLKDLRKNALNALILLTERRTGFDSLYEQPILQEVID